MANVDYSIIAGVYIALRDAVQAEVGVFKTIGGALSAEQAEECQFVGEVPHAVILYNGTDESRGVPNERYCRVSLTLYIATKVDPAKDEIARMQELLRLMNLAKNAVEADLSAFATGFGDGEGDYHPAGAVWGSPDPSPSEKNKPPWVAFTLPVSFGYVLANPTSH